MTASERRLRADEDTSLPDLGRALLRFHLDFAALLLPLALIAALAAAIYVHMKPIYEAKGLLFTPKLTLDEWRHLSPLLPDPRLVTATLQTLGVVAGDGSDAMPAANRLRRILESQAFWDRSLQYRSALRRDDLRDAPASDPRMSTTLGIEVSIRSPSREDAAQTMNAIALHVRQTLFWSMLDTFLDDKQATSASRKAELKVTLTKLAFSMAQTETRITGMRRLLEAYPDLRGVGGSTIVSPENGGGRYLSPAAQLVALESTLLDQQTQVQTAQRELEILGSYERFLSHAAARPDDIRSGSRLADWLDGKRGEFFTAATGPEIQTDQEIAFAIAEARARADRIVFNAAPVIGLRPIATRSPLPVAVTAFFASLILFSLLLAIYRVVRRLDRPANEPWFASRDPLFAWLPSRLRGGLFRYERRYQACTGLRSD